MNLFLNIVFSVIIVKIRFPVLSFIKTLLNDNEYYV